MATHREEEIVPAIGEVVRLEAGRVAGRGPGRAAAALSSRAAASPAARAASGRPVFVLRDVTVLVDGRPVLRDLDWTVRAGERWGVLGPNAAGKSTLLRLLAGEEQPAAGVVERLDLGPRADRFALAGRVGLVSPELQARHRHGALAEHVVASGFEGTIGVAGPPPPARLAAALAAMDRLGLSPLAGRDVAALSYGETRRLLIARALAPGPEVLLLDEPLAGLDPFARAAALDAVEEAARAGTTLVVVTHHEDELPPSLGRLARLEGGRLVVRAP
jgi:molybdate transport system ATP-binding protein